MKKYHIFLERYKAIQNNIPISDYATLLVQYYKTPEEFVDSLVNAHHQSNSVIKKFNSELLGKSDYGYLGNGAYFTEI